MSWTDIWCFTCDHEIKQEPISGTWLHIDDDDERVCICNSDGINCEPR